MKKIFILPLVAMTLIWSSCKKTDTASSTTSYLSIVNASPTLATYNIYLNESKLNTSALPFGGTLTYATLASGTYSTKFTAESSTESLLSKSLTLADQGVYSYFLIGQEGQLDGVLATDVMTSGSTKAAIRFVNLSPDAPALDLAVNGGNTVINNQYYKQVSDFVAVDPNTYSFDIKDRSTGLVKTSLNGVTLAAGKYYTLMIRGMLSPKETEHPISAQLITNL